MADDPLAPLERLALRHPDLEAEVCWLHDGAWSDATGERLEAEEIAFYAEGLVMEGFGCHWQVLGTGGHPDLCRLFFWPADAKAPPPLPDITTTQTVLAEGRT